MSLLKSLPILPPSPHHAQLRGFNKVVTDTGLRPPLITSPANGLTLVKSLSHDIALKRILFDVASGKPRESMAGSF